MVPVARAATRSPWPPARRWPAIWTGWDFGICLTDPSYRLATRGFPAPDSRSSRHRPTGFGPDRIGRVTPHPPRKLSSSATAARSPSLAERARTRRYSTSYKAGILAEHEGLDKAGKGAMSRREAPIVRLTVLLRDVSPPTKQAFPRSPIRLVVRDLSARPKIIFEGFCVQG
jgi:hypothetical protein